MTNFEKIQAMSVEEISETRKRGETNGQKSINASI